MNDSFIYLYIASYVELENKLKCPRIPYPALDISLHVMFKC